MTRQFPVLEHDPETMGRLHTRVVIGELAALEPALLDHINCLQAEDPLRSVVVLVGGTLLRPYLRRGLAERHGAHLNVHILTAGELALRLGELPCILAGRRPLPLLADRLLAQQAGAADTDGYFAAVGETPGFGDALHRTLAELRRAGIDDAALAAAAPTALEPDKTAALARLAGAHGRLRGAHYDTDAALAVADPGRLVADELLVYGLWEAPALLRRALAAVALRVPLTVYLPSAGAAADRAHAELRGWLTDELGAVAESLPAVAASGTLRHVQRHVAGGQGAPADDGSVRLLSAPDPTREVRAALRACLTWARQDDIPLHEMAIAYRHADPYRALVEAVGREAGVPVYLHAGTPVAELPMGRRVLALLDLLEGDLDRASVIAFAADARFPSGRRYAGEATAWDRASRRAGVLRGAQQWRERLSAYAESERGRAGEPPPDWLGRQLDAINGLQQLVADLARLRAEWPAAAPWSAHVERFAEALATFVDGHAPVLDAVRALGRLDAVTGQVPRERFGRAVRGIIDGLSEREARAGAPTAFRARGINVIDVSSLRHLRFRAVCVLGLAERWFPPAPREDPLLLDAERAQLNTSHGWWLPLRAHGSDPEPLQFALACAAAEERLLLSHPRTEHGSGRPQYASGFLRAAAEALAGEPVSAEEIATREDWPWLERVPAGRLGAGDESSALDLRDRDRTLLEGDERQLALALLGEAAPAVARGRAAWLARESSALTVYDGVLGEGAESLLVTHPRLTGALSPTALERFGRCPMQFFLAQVLGLRDDDEPEELPRLDRLHRGELIHTVLERTLARLLPGDPPSAARRAAHHAILDEETERAFDEKEAEGVTGHPALWAIDQALIRAELRLWYEHEIADPQASSFDRAAFEVSFGHVRTGERSRSRPDPVEFAAGRRTLRVSGRLDRLQWSDQGPAFRVVDYKSGKSRDASKRFDGGKRLQLPLYLHAAAELLERDWRAGLSEYFFVTRAGGFSRQQLSGEQLEEARADFDRLLAVLAEAVFTGVFRATPDRHCTWCAFRGLCPAQKAHEERIEGKAGDLAGALLDELEQIE